MIGIFVDVPNVFFNCKKKWGGRLNYLALWDHINDQEGPNKIIRAIAYGSQVDNEATPFIHALRHIGFECKWQTLQSYEKAGEKVYRHADLGVTIAMDVVRNAQRISTLVLVSSDPALAPLIEWSKEQGIKVIVIGARISNQLKAVASKWTEINENFVEVSDEEPKASDKP
jgi:uncharacterized LabA/DUF88 family protein